MLVKLIIWDYHIFNWIFVRGLTFTSTLFLGVNLDALLVFRMNWINFFIFTGSWSQLWLLFWAEFYPLAQSSLRCTSFLLLSGLTRSTMCMDSCFWYSSSLWWWPSVWQLSAHIFFLMLKIIDGRFQYYFPKGITSDNGEE